MPAPFARTQRRNAFLFLIPFFVLFVATTIAPLAYAIWLSMFSQQSSGLGFGGAEQVFVGIGNYAKAIADEAFQEGFLTVAAYIALYVPVMVGTALVLALLLDSGLALARRFLQVALFLPHAVPGLIAAIIWLYLYAPGLSPVMEWLGDPETTANLASTHPLLSVVNIAVWQWIGYNVVIFYAALQAVPREVLEAASIDGATVVQQALRIKTPMIKPAVIMATLFTIIGSVQLFTEPKILAPVSTAITNTWTPNLFTQEAAFTRNDFGLASAASILIAFVAAALSFAVMRFVARRSAP